MVGISGYEREVTRRHWYSVLVVSSLLFFGLALSPDRAEATEFLVNTATDSDQEVPRVATLSGGGFVIVWEDNSLSSDDPSGKAIRAQRYDATSAPQGVEFLVNTTISDRQSQPSVAALTGGGFVVAWTDRSQSGGDILEDAIRAQRFDATGTKQGAEFLVNTTTPGDQTAPIIAGLLNGGFIIAWTDNGDASGGAIRAQRYNAIGVTQGIEFLVNTTNTGFQATPKAVALTGGGFVIAWIDLSQTGGDTSDFAIRAQRYNNAGTTQGPEFLVNTTTAGNQVSPDVAALNNGGFVIAWEDLGQTSSDPDGDAVLAQRYTATGVPQGVEFLVNTTTANNQFSPNVAALNNGGFIIAWTDGSQTGGDLSGNAVRAQNYDAAGAPQGGEFLVNTTTTSDQEFPSVATLNNGSFVIAWRDSSRTGGDTGSGSAVRADVFSGAGTTLFSSVLPAARTGFFPGGPVVTVFASVINAGSNAATSCVIRIPESDPVSLNYQLTDALNVPTGPGDVPFDIAVGQTRSFILAFTPTATSPGKTIFPDFVCSNANVAPIPGVNTAFLSITNTKGPDILSIGATTSNDGIINILAGGGGVMTASAVNIGTGNIDSSADASVAVTADTGGAGLKVLLQWCEIDSDANCITPLGSTLINTTIGATPKFFAVFAFDQTNGAGIPLDAATARVFLRFRGFVGGTNLSVTSAAVTVATP
ncbi:hypothetical protein MNBD_ALPHA06-2140 [hydrothermal vent metagenome]|uniref:Uncharacterized protein n=1 Tax=hydrothermal vent metagenome TaxID=652676 RepID=A0A3B0R411_9ZZZZ